MKEFISLLFGNVSPIQFLSILFIAYLTAFTMLLVGTTKRDPASERSPFCFSWRFLLSDEFKRIIGNMLLIILAIRFSQKWISPEWNVYAGFGIGLLSDKLAMLFITLQERLAELTKNKIQS